MNNNEMLKKIKKSEKDIVKINEQLDNKAQQVDLKTLESRMDTFTSLPDGSTTGDAELMDGRVGITGTVYDSIGIAIREQFKNVTKIINDMLNSYTTKFIDMPVKVLDNWIQVDGSESDYNKYKHIKIVGIKKGEIYKIKNECGNNVRAYVIKNSGGYVTRSYKAEIFNTNHDYDLTVTINADEEGGTLYVNTIDNNYIGIKKQAGLEIAPSTEILDARKGVDGKIYESLGDAIREQIENIDKTTDNVTGLYVPHFGELSVTVLETWIEKNGSSSTFHNYKHVKIANVKAGSLYKIKNQCGANVRAYVLKNAEGNVVEVAPEQPYGTKNEYTLEVTIPSTANGGTLYVNTYSANYIGVKTVTGMAIDSTQLANKNIFMVSNLYKKTIYFFGDSITANKGSWGDADTIRAKYSMSGANFAVGGMTYTVLSTSNDTNNIYLRMKSKLSEITKADYICFQGATNDAFRGVPLGEMLDENDFTTEVSTSTFAGAFEMSCRLLRTQVPQAKLLYLANIKIPRNKNLINYVNMAKKICNKYSIKYLDLWNDSGMCPGIQSFNDKYYSIDPSVSTEHGDQTHMTIEGYKNHLNDKVDFTLNSL